MHVTDVLADGLVTVAAGESAPPALVTKNTTVAEAEVIFIKNGG
jgi:hypothetical protein